MSKLESLCAEALSRDAREPVIEFQQRWYTWGDLRGVAERVTELMKATGADPRAPVAFIARNRPSAVGALFALIRQARHVRMIYVFQSPAAIARNLDRVKPAVAVIMAEDDSDELRSVLRERGIAAIVLDGHTARLATGCEASTAAWDPPPPVPEIQVLTSGTTGPPKQFAVSYDLIAKHMVGENIFASQPPMGAPQPPPIYLYFPLGNITGIYSTIPSLVHGLRIVLGDRFSVQEWHDYVLRYRPAALGLPPAAVQMVLDAGIPKADLASISHIATGAAPLDPSVQRAFEERYGIPILLSYGATEFAGPVAMMTPALHAAWGQKKFGSVGRPITGAKLRVIDADTHALLPPGAEGILEVMVPQIGPQWIRTSDIAVIDSDGFLFHRGRADGAIVRGGFKILPETIERALLLHDAVAAAGVVGIPDRRLGQVPAAVIEVKPRAQQPSPDELERHLRDHVLATHIPTAWRFVKELPKNPSFKIDRAALRRLFEPA